MWGGVTADAASTPLPIAWKKWDKAVRATDPAAVAKPDYDDSTWPAIDPSQLALNITRGDSWYRGTFNITASQVHSMIEAPHLDSFNVPKPQRGVPVPPKIIVYLNGRLLNDPVVDASKILVSGKKHRAGFDPKPPRRRGWPAGPRALARLPVGRRRMVFPRRPR